MKKNILLLLSLLLSSSLFAASANDFCSLYSLHTAKNYARIGFIGDARFYLEKLKDAPSDFKNIAAEKDLEPLKKAINEKFDEYDARASKSCVTPDSDYCYIHVLYMARVSVKNGTVEVAKAALKKAKNAAIASTADIKDDTAFLDKIKELLKTYEDKADKNCIIRK